MAWLSGFSNNLLAKNWFYLRISSKFKHLAFYENNIDDLKMFLNIEFIREITKNL